MDFRFLGTAASEGFPAVFCNCEYCKIARKKGGKNIRTRSQSLIDNDLLIDLPADTYHHALTCKIELDKIKYLLITHFHSDHFYPDELGMRGRWFAHDMRSEKIKIVLSEPAYNYYMDNVGKGLHESIANNIELKVVKPFDEITLGDYNITVLPARHMGKDDCALMYIIRKEGKTILYAHDTGYFFESVFDYIKEKKVRFDFITYDCTNIEIPIEDDSVHMGFDNIERVNKRLKETGAINEKTVLYTNHFSHNANPMYRETVKKAKKFGLKVSYDGLKIKI